MTSNLENNLSSEKKIVGNEDLQVRVNAMFERATLAGDKLDSLPKLQCRNTVGCGGAISRPDILT